MKKRSMFLAAAMTCMVSMSGTAAVVPSADVMAQQQVMYNKQQILNMVDTAEVQAQLEALGVSSADAKARIDGLTNAELNQLNQQLNDAPAGGIVGLVITVAVVLAVLDLLGVTDVYPFINPV